MAISVTEPIGRAFERMKVVLFGPFELRKWFVLGFCAFLAQLGEGGGGSSSQYRMGSRASGLDLGEMLRKMTQWVEGHLPIVVMVMMAGIAVSVALGALIAWLNSRGKFMFLDGVVRNRGAVVEPWHRLRAEGNSLFVFRFVLMLIGTAVGLVVMVVCLVVAWPDMRAGRLGVGLVTALVLAVGTMLPFGLAVAVLKAVLADFVVPIMYRRRVSALDGLGMLWREMVRGYFGWFVLFYLLEFVLGLAAAIVVLVGTCLTCCIAGLPYISSVVFLPVTVFFRSYSLYFLEQFGAEWRLMDAAP